MRIDRVLPSDIPAVWPLVSDWIEDGCARPGCDYSPVSVFAMLLNVEAALCVLVGDDERPAAAGVTQVRRHEDGRLSCWIPLLGGTKPGPWPDVISQIEEGAARIGCASVEFVGRPGWKRVLRDYTAAPHPAGLHFRKLLTRH